MTLRLHHVVVVVSNLEQALGFYEGLLGLGRRFEMTTGGEPLKRALRLETAGTARSVFLRGPHPTSLLELIEITPGPARRATSGELGLGIQILSLESLDKDLRSFAQELETSGVEVFSPFHSSDIEGYGRIATVIVRDPDGNLVELVRHPDRAPRPEAGA